MDLVCISITPSPMSDWVGISRSSKFKSTLYSMWGPCNIATFKNATLYKRCDRTCWNIQALRSYSRYFFYKKNSTIANTQKINE